MNSEVLTSGSCQFWVYSTSSTANNKMRSSLNFLFKFIFRIIQFIRKRINPNNPTSKCEIPLFLPDWDSSMRTPRRPSTRTRGAAWTPRSHRGLNQQPSCTRTSRWWGWRCGARSSPSSSARRRGSCPPRPLLSPGIVRGEGRAVKMQVWMYRDTKCYSFAVFCTVFW